MRAALFLFFILLSFFSYSQSDDRVKLRDLQEAPASGYYIRSVNDTSAWVLNDAFADSLAVVQDSILVFFASGSEVFRDTVGPFGSDAYYQTIRDDGIPMTQRAALNFVSTSTVNTVATDDSGNGETEVAFSVPTGGIGPTELASTAVTPGSYTYAGFTVDADGRLTAAASGTTPVTGTGAANHIPYWTGTNTMSYDNGQLYWDDGNNRLGIGTTSPARSLDIVGTMRVQTASLFNVFISGGNLTATGSSNFAIGSTTLANLTSGSYNVAIGGATLANVTTQNNNMALGNEAARQGTPSNITAIGTQAHYGVAGITTASNSVAIGYLALPVIRTGSNNVSIGAESGRNTSTGGNSLNIGYQSGYLNFTGSGNINLGYQAGYNNTSSNMLHIDNSNTTSPLIGGNLSSNYLGVNTAVASLGAALHVTGTGATSATVNLFAENSSGTDLLYLDNSGQLGLKTNLPARTLHVEGEARITDLTTDTPTRIVGADADGDLGEITVGSGLTLSAGSLTANAGAIDHGGLLGLADDDHTQYLLLAGRATGQIATGGTASGDDLTLRSTTNATKGDVIIQDQGGNVIIGGAATASRLRMMEASGSGTNYTEFVTQAQAANIAYTLPADDGDAGEQLQTNGSGTLSWEPTGKAPDVQLYQFGGTDTYVIPTGVRTVEIICIGAGGGGGSGRRGATTEANTGGGGGGGGAYTSATFATSSLSSTTLNLTIGAGGAGGASRFTDNTSGAGGGTGGATYVECSSYTLIYAGGGTGGGAGSTTTNTGGAGATIGDYNGVTGAGCPDTGSPSSPSAANQKSAAGGGAGGGVPTGGTPARNGGSTAKWGYGQQAANTGGTAPGGSGQDADALDSQHFIGGNGGSGGASSITANAGGGGDGLQGGGGGGGGASLNATGNSGAGGTGGDGFIMIIAKY